MYRGKRILALIPARGGSKGLKRKNIRLLSGRPLVAWAIEQAKGSGYIDRIVVTTDDSRIAAVSRRYGADVPFMRPRKLATDSSRGMDVILHALDRVEGSGDKYDVFIYLQPTSPLRSSKDCDKAIELFFSKKAKAVISVCKCEHLPLQANTLPWDGNMKDFLDPSVVNKNRQEFPEFYRMNGAIFMADCGYIRKGHNFFGNKTFAYVMPKERSVDINDDMDLEFAKFMLKRRSNAR
jgi:N-acylneuraminate cytidylyltransferase/CMP-N,N'-diacetyllegionaminic acid synthase